MKKYGVLGMGILLFVISVLWMLLERSSTGYFLILASISGALVVDGIFKLRSGK